MLQLTYEAMMSTSRAPDHELSQAFWHACNAGQRRAAELLLDAGAAMDRRRRRRMISGSRS